MFSQSQKKKLVKIIGDSYAEQIRAKTIKDMKKWERNLASAILKEFVYKDSIELDEEKIISILLPIIGEPIGDLIPRIFIGMDEIHNANSIKRAAHTIATNKEVIKCLK